MTQVTGPGLGMYVFQFVTLAGMIIPVVVAAFVIYFLTKVIVFMKQKTEHDAILLNKIDKLIELQSRNNQTTKAD